MPSPLSSAPARLRPLWRGGPLSGLLIGRPSPRPDLAPVRQATRPQREGGPALEKVARSEREVPMSIGRVGRTSQTSRAFEPPHLPGRGERTADRLRRLVPETDDAGTVRRDDSEVQHAPPFLSSSPVTIIASARGRDGLILGTDSLPFESDRPLVDGTVGTSAHPGSAPKAGTIVSP